MGTKRQKITYRQKLVREQRRLAVETARQRRTTQIRIAKWVAALTAAGMIAFFFYTQSGRQQAVPAAASTDMPPSSEISLPAPTPAPTPAPISTPAPTPSAHTGISDSEILQLDALCSEMPGSLSLAVLDLDSGDSYAFQTAAGYYCASLLKAPYALWLCHQADAGAIALDSEINYPVSFHEKDGYLSAYNDSLTLPATAALQAMIIKSDNNATVLLSSAWPGTEDFENFLSNELHFSSPESCGISNGEIHGYITAADMLGTLQALYDYFESNAAHAAFLKETFLAADHDILYFPDGISAAKKSGSWDGAFHDIAVVYAPHPYLIAALSSWGNQDVDFPPEAVARMQQLGQLAWQVTQDEPAPQNERATPEQSETAQDTEAEAAAAFSTPESSLPKLGDSSTPK